MTRHPLAAWVTDFRADLRARAWLNSAVEPDLIGAEALRLLNRHAFAVKYLDEGESFRIYYLKRFVIRALFDIWPCRITTQTQKLTCSSCGGLGVWSGGPPWDRYHECCFRCGGTGIYRLIDLYSFDFNIASRYFCWHQPADLCGWAADHVSGDSGEYTADRSAGAGDRLTRDHVAVLAAALRLWLGARIEPLVPGGQPLAHVWPRPCLRAALRSELRMLRYAATRLPAWLRWRIRVLRGQDLPF